MLCVCAIPAGGVGVGHGYAIFRSAPDACLKSPWAIINADADMLAALGVPGAAKAGG